MKRLSNNRDLFEAAAGEVITVTVEAKKTPFHVTYSDLSSGGIWTVVQVPTAQLPVEKRQFTMPGGSRETFVIVYGFPPAGTADAGAKYKVSFTGAGGTSDGPNGITPLAFGDLVDLPYEFRLPNTPIGHFLTNEMQAMVVNTAPIPLATNKAKKSVAKKK